MNIIEFTVMTIFIFMKERYKMYIIIGFLIILIDQFVKIFVIENITYGNTIGKYIRITNIQNTGIAYSMRSK